MPRSGTSDAIAALCTPSDAFHLKREVTSAVGDTNIRRRSPFTRFYCCKPHLHPALSAHDSRDCRIRRFRWREHAQSTINLVEVISNAVGQFVASRQHHPTMIEFKIFSPCRFIEGVG